MDRDIHQRQPNSNSSSSMVRNLAALLLIVSLAVGYVLFVHEKRHETASDFITGMSEFADTLFRSPEDSAPSVDTLLNDNATATVSNEDAADHSEDHDREHEHEHEHRHEHDHEEDECTPSFTREFMIDCEGYYRSAEDADEDLPWPRPNRNNWPCPDQKQRWMSKLKKIQEVSQIKTIPADAGFTASRVDAGKQLGNKLFINRDRNQEGRPICWTGDLLPHYIDRYNVIPTEEFYFWVAEYEL